MCQVYVTIYPCGHEERKYSFCRAAKTGKGGERCPCTAASEYRRTATAGCYLGGCDYLNAGRGNWTCCKCENPNSGIPRCDHLVPCPDIFNVTRERYEPQEKMMNCGHDCCQNCQKERKSPPTETRRCDY
ncbi:hypothetical protein B0T26DRAFT_636270 [Lasiosphaeria miniovina]|uniref:Uncharacterized protein n=1 Tax=Lasiosphaeria miniovina TaxID=1954250 RepID=A0AA40B4D7_9PEZI|nr:uncharacterized protein B0T26DRAFT_636270 [Lasiosphaeria miniovina]KAK0727483.1 hypothetical protein B0T26DRAFT_636270 [Lasiosphaeria miniovina]